MSEPIPREPVRLVVWDLDETFWRGTLTEGGITEYLEKNHNLVIELARRGIVSSICSKNDEAPVLEILRARGILDYFVMPSISWTPKGPRLASLVEAMQLRPPSVLFVDDNANNRAEAAALVPGIQIEDETVAAKMLTDPRFKGKDDAGLTRLNQYKLLEARKQDERLSDSSNEDFLRSCDVQVCMEFDIAAHLDRAVELVNRTNQLNFTKSRLSEDVEAAGRELLKEISSFACQAGLVRVRDRYGDYGFVGFFVTETLRREHSPGSANSRLRHFCFSCRTLGMLIEQWTYEHLGRPELAVVGEVLTDLSAPRAIDWVRLVPGFTAEAAATGRLAPEIRVYGGCEANPIGVYLGTQAAKVEVIGNYRAGGLFVRVNSAEIALSTFDRRPGDFAAEAAALSLPLDLSARDLFAGAPPGAAFVVSCGFDARSAPRYRHRAKGWLVALEILGDPAFNLVTASAEEVAQRLSHRPPHILAEKSRIEAVAAHLRQHYSTHPMDAGRRDAALCALIDRVPPGSRLVLVLDHDQVRGADGVLRDAGFVTDYNRMARSIAGKAPWATTVSFSDAIEREEEIQVGGNHYERMVYFRLAQAIIAALRATPARAPQAEVA